jgi:hypothetical protein
MTDQDERTADNDLYVFTDEDIADITSEVFIHIREHPALSDAEAVEIADACYELMTGDWLTHE